MAPDLPIKPGSIPRRRAPSRRGLAGTVDQAFIDSDLPLPPDFDAAFWNAAPVDQQAAYLRGDETVELVNLCRPDTPGVIRDARGNSWLTLQLLGDECFVLCRLRDGTLTEQPLVIDTVLIEPEQHRVSLVWRGILSQEVVLSTRRTEVRMRSLEAGDIARAERNALRHQFDIAAAGIATPGMPDQTTEQGQR